jgi:short subunit dehydrogenase-like uncharacterized protein
LTVTKSVVSKGPALSSDTLESWRGTAVRTSVTRALAERSKDFDSGESRGAVSRDAMARADIAVFGASGHTGRFVVKELCRRGRTPVLLGRDRAKLAALSDEQGGIEIRVATIEEPPTIVRALAGVGAVINCAGPFLDTASRLVGAALRAHVHYLDVTAEQASAQATLEQFEDAAAAANIAVVPAMAFYGGLADLLATAAMAEWTAADEIAVAIALDGWWPTPGTRRTAERNTARRVVVSKGATTFLADPPPRRRWGFPRPFEAQEVVEVPLSEIITISRHLSSPEIHSYMNLAPLAHLHDPQTPPPRAADDSGRSGQKFLMEVIARSGDEERRATARGRDIYAFTAPLVVEAAERILDGRAGGVGTFAPGELFDARDFLASLTDLEVEYR